MSVNEAQKDKDRFNLVQDFLLSVNAPDEVIMAHHDLFLAAVSCRSRMNLLHDVIRHAAAALGLVTWGKPVPEMVMMLVRRAREATRPPGKQARNIHSN